MKRLRLVFLFCLLAISLSQAQSDFATLQSNAPSTAAPAPSTTLSSAFSKLSQDLQSGNLAGAQQDYSTIQQDFQQQAPAATSAYHHHHHSSGGSSDPAAQASLDQLFSQLRQALQSGNLATAQSVYASLQQDLAPLANSSSTSTGNSSSNTNSDSGAKTTNSLLSISI